MADFRQIHTRIWKDNWFSELEMDAKLLFIYLFSNERASVSGIYELPLKYISFETGIEFPRLIELLDQFKAAGKVEYEDGIIWVVNLRKYNETASPKVQTRLSKDVSGIPDSHTLQAYCKYYRIPYPYPIDTPFINEERDRDRDRDRKETETEDAASPAFSTSPDIQAERVFQTVSKMITFPSEKREDCIGAIRSIMAFQKIDANGAIAYLQPYFNEWRERGYMAANTAWLTEWAVSGEIPPRRSNGSGKRKRILTGANGEQIEVDE